MDIRVVGGRTPAEGRLEMRWGNMQVQKKNTDLMVVPGAWLVETVGGFRRPWWRASSLA